MNADRMERVKQKAREHWADTMRPLTQYPLAAYLMGAEYGAEHVLVLTDAEWAEMREKAAQAIWANECWVLASVTEWSFWVDVNAKEVARFRGNADAAMRAVGLRREGE